jgi:hypothetical protein
LKSTGRTFAAFQLTLALACWPTFMSGAEPGQAMEEYRLKAAFVSSFAGFVEWPQEVLKSPQDPIGICVLGENPFGSALDQAIAGKTFRDHKLAAKEISDVRQATGCQILFISSSERKHLRTILRGPEVNGVLTVGESDEFTTEGGVIDLKVDGDRIRILVNLEAAEQSHLRISSKLLSLAKIVKK